MEDSNQNILDLAQKALEIIESTGKSSVSLLQRKLGIGYSKTSQVMRYLEDNGKFSKSEYSKLLELKKELNTEFLIKAKTHNAFEKLNSRSWVAVLPKFEDIADSLDVWKNFETSNWVDLLLKEFNYSKKANTYKAWNNFNNNDWLKLLKNDSDFLAKADEYNAWKKLNSWDWSCLLSKKPEFLDKAKMYNAFKKFDGTDWKNLICSQVKFAKIADEFAKENIDEKGKCLWDKISSYSWANLLILDKGFFVDIAEKHNVFNKLSGEEWAILLSANLEFFKAYSDKFNAWKNLDGKDWEKFFLTLS